MKPIFTHCALHVQNLTKSVEFYEKYCGMKVIHEHGKGPNDHAIWMSEDGRETELVFVFLLGGQGHIQPKGDLTHFGFALNSKEEVDHISEEGRKNRVLAWESKQFGYPVGYRSALFDPDGYIIEFSFGQPLGPEE